MTKKLTAASKKIMGKKLDGEWVLLNLENGVYYGLNETGSLIWDQLSEKQDVEIAVSHLQKIFNVDRTRLLKDVNSLLKELGKEGLIDLESHPQKA